MPRCRMMLPGGMTQRDSRPTQNPPASRHSFIRLVRTACQIIRTATPAAISTEMTFRWRLEKPR